MFIRLTNLASKDFQRVTTEANQKCNFTSISELSAQQVAGMIYNAKINFQCEGAAADECPFRVWQKPWLNLTKFFYDCDQFKEFSDKDSMEVEVDDSATPTPNTPPPPIEDDTQKH